MSTAVAERKTAAADAPQDELAVFRKQDAIVAYMREQYMGLTIKGIGDKKGFEAVHDARMIVKKARVDVEKTRTTLKAEILERGRKIDAEAKRVTGLLAPIEEHLEAEETAVTNERERIKREAEEVRKAKISARFESLQAAGYTGNMMLVPEMDDEAFSRLLLAAQEDKAERDRLAEEERQRQAAEQERLRKLEAEQAEARRKQEGEAAAKRAEEEAALAAERERLAKVKAEQEAEAARLRAEQQRIEVEKEATRRAAELEKAKAEAAERSRVETEQRLAREQAEAKAETERKEAQAKADAEAKEQARLKADAERPHREKLLAVAYTVGQITVPKGPRFNEVVDVLKGAAAEIRAIANGPLK